MGHEKKKANNRGIVGWTVGDWGSVLLRTSEKPYRMQLRVYHQEMEKLGAHLLIVVSLWLRSVLSVLNTGQFQVVLSLS